MARLIFSSGMFSDLAARTAVRRRALLSGLPPPLAATAISFRRRVNILPRLASSAPFLCLIVAHFEWPDIRTSTIELQYGRGRTPAHVSIPPVRMGQNGVVRVFGVPRKPL